MPTNKATIFANDIAETGTSFTDADTTVAKAIFLAPADGSTITNINATSDDTSDVIAVITKNDGSNDFIIGEITIPAGAGTDGVTPAKSLLDSVAIPGALQNDGSMILKAAWSIKVNAKVTMTAAKQVDIVASGGGYAV